MSSVVISGDISGSVTLDAPSVAGTTVLTLPAGSGTVLTTNASSITPEANGGTGTTTGYYGFKNRIINGAMVIDQRNAGASYSVTAGVFGYVSLDRYRVNNSTDGAFTLQQSTTAPTGFSNSLIATVTTTDTSIAAGQFAILQQNIEGFNVADLGFGTAGASTITLSFWVRSSITGTFGGALLNAASDRSYPFIYTINSANTFEQKTITLVGDTSGTWLKTNGIGLNVVFSLAVGSTYTGTAGSWAGGTFLGATGQTNLLGTNGATFYITGVQLEKGSTATSFDYRPYGTELALCQRYYWKWSPASSNDYAYTGLSLTTVDIYGTLKLPVTMRTSPTLTTSGTASDYGGYQGGSLITCSIVPRINTSNTDILLMNHTFASGLTVGYASIMGSKTSAGYLGFNAEL